MPGGRWANSAPRDPGNPVLWASAEEVAERAKWALLRPGDALYPVTWEPPSGLPGSALAAEDYLKDARQRPAKGGGSTLRAWASRDKSDIAGSLAFFYRTRPAEMELLETLSRFPCLSLKAYEKLYPHAKAVRKLHARMKALLSNELAIRVEGPAHLYLPGEKGLALLAGLSGVKPEAANRYLGFPVRPGRFRTQVEHHRITADFMLRLFSEGSLSAWDFIASRFVFSNLRAPSEPRDPQARDPAQLVRHAFLRQWKARPVLAGEWTGAHVKAGAWTPSSRSIS